MCVTQEAKVLAAGRAGTRDVFEQKPTSQFDERNREPAPAKYVQGGPKVVIKILQGNVKLS